MLLNLLDSYLLSGLTLAVLSSIGILHFLLFSEYIKQEKLHIKRLQNLEELVRTELDRSRAMDSQNQSLTEIRTRTDEQLEVIKLQTQTMKALEEKKNSNS